MGSRIVLLKNVMTNRISGRSVKYERLMSPKHDLRWCRDDKRT